MLACARVVQVRVRVRTALYPRARMRCVAGTAELGNGAGDGDSGVLRPIRSSRQRLCELNRLTDIIMGVSADSGIIAIS